ncbi:MAG: DUF1016 N-terminal domain-containing protein [Paludibacteraceae bacterium]|nr:DUF1016 N-terminal domain-containing protein [Paludibacteraceae bacterium]
MMQFYREYNQELTFVKLPVSQIDGSDENVKPTVSQKFMLPIIHISWAHNVVLMQWVKDIDARYWYMIRTIERTFIKTERFLN